MKRKKVAALLITMSLATAGAATAITGCGAFAGTDESQETYTDDTGDEKTIDLGEINIDDDKNTPVDKVKEDKNGDSIVNAKEDAEEKQVDGSENELSDKGSALPEKTVRASWTSNNTIEQVQPSMPVSNSRPSASVKPSVPVKDDKTDDKVSMPEKDEGESSKPVTPSKPYEKPETPSDPVKDDTSENPIIGDEETVTEPEVPVQPPKGEDTTEDTDESVKPENPDDESQETDDGNEDSGQDFDTDEDTGDTEEPDEDDNPSTPEEPGAEEDAGDEEPTEPGVGDVTDDESTTNPDGETPDTDDGNGEEDSGQIIDPDGDIDEPGTETPEHVHEWEDHYITVDVPEVGHYENVLKSEAWTETINHPEESHVEYVNHPEESHYEQKWVYQCHGCKKKFYTDAEVGAHMEEQMLAGNLACGGYSSFMDTIKVVDKAAWTEEVKVVDKEAWTEYIEHEAVYEQVWVVDEEAHTEMVVDGQICADCGEWKE